MDKLKMAHDYLRDIIKASGGHINVVEMPEAAWKLADAMQAEADERNKAEAEQKRKAVREMLNAENTFLEKEGQHFDDVADVCETYSSSEWQPDWSQAPDSKVKYFAVDENGRGGWYITEPALCSDHWYWSDWGERMPSYDNAGNFGYTGTWQDSLRKRPSNI